MKSSLFPRCWRAISTALFLFLAGCETTPGAADVAALSKIKRVGVVSAAGDRLSYHQLGTLVFGNKSQSFDIRDWRLDDAWEAKITATASALGSYEFVDLDVDREPLYATYPPENAWPREWRVLNLKKAQLELQRIAQENGLDAVIVLGSDGLDIQRGGIVLEGVSIFTNAAFGSRATSYQLFVSLYLIDGVTGAPIASRRVGKDDIFGPTGSGESAPESLKAKPFSEYSAEEVAIARDIFARLADPYWEKAVQRLIEPRK